ncbi:MAG: hypothetical protein IPP47_29100 [Bryobacterales bacterium]|nr:hypothetical protein [Bryobacterales bacterium]
MTGIAAHPHSPAIRLALLVAAFALTAQAAPPEFLPTAAILDAASLDPARDIPSGGWFVVRGRNLSGALSVTIAGQASVIVRSRPGVESGLAYDELLAIAPALPPGPAPVVVTTPAGATPPRTVQCASFSPSLFGLELSGGRYADASASEGAESIGPLNLYGSQPLERPIRPAVPSEVITLRANGCGLSTTTTVAWLGQTAAEVVFSGVEVAAQPACVVRIRIPALTPGEYEVRVAMDGRLLSPPRWLAIGTAPFPGYEHGSESGYRLTGAHVAVPCAQCHLRDRYLGTPTACEACHLERFQNTTAPDHRIASYPTNCALCHQTSQFQGARAGHPTAAFPLTGKHTAARCGSCHTASAPPDRPSAECAACHLPNHNSAASYGQQCAVCHTPSGWTPARPDHGKTRFPLTGRHAAAVCQSCHPTTAATPPDRSCQACHLGRYQATTSPNHTALEFPTGCDACHTTAAFLPAAVDHPRQRFPLTGKHAGLSCSACHQGGRFSPLDPSCANCHLPPPEHKSAGFPQSCNSCHTPAAWQGAAIRHHRFPLTGRHAAATCLGCHPDNQFAGTPRTCSACHLPQYQAMTNPNHAAEGFSTECQLCHSPTQFFGARIVHPQFVQSGKHARLECAQCHTIGSYKGTPQSCDACHLPAYNSAPNHKSSNFPLTCESCHTPVAWKGAVMNHAKLATPLPACSTCHMAAYDSAPNHKAASFPQACDTCHTTKAWKGAALHTKFAGALPPCATCHLPAYTTSSSPNHKSAGLPQTCESCHTTTSWFGARFTHKRYALTGRHATLKCSQCHTNGTFYSAPTTCSSCHIGTFAKTSNPNHSAAGYPQSCESCHTTTAWKGATVPHSRFPLTGRHTNAPCATCHPSGRYTGTPTDCASCHLAAPGHQAAGFSSNCLLCHSTTAWQGAAFTHRVFSLAGKHASLPCAQCHASGVYAARPSTCVSCHLARYTSSTQPNHSAKAYPQNCERCHSPAAWSPSSFQHAFPIASGAHNNRWSRCTDCHSSSSAWGAVSCLGCHNQSATTTKHKSVKAFAYNSPNCLGCHPRP